MPGSYAGSKILVPLDGSHDVRAALGPAADLAAASHGELVLTLVINDGFERMVSGLVHIEHTTPEVVAKTYLNDVRDGLCGELDDIDVSFEIRTSEEVVDTLLQVAEDVGATMIALTSHGYTGFKKAWLGSVAEAVLDRSVIPVLLVPMRPGF